MNRSGFGLVGIVIVGMFLALILAGCGEEEEKTDSAAGYDFTLSDLGGEQVSFSDFEGQVIMVNFWAPWCGPCRAETPDLIKLSEQYQDRGFQLLGVAVAFKSEQSVHDFAMESGISYPVLLGNNELVKQYGGFRGIPTTFLFSRDGRLHKKFTGMRPREELALDIEELL
ncbi:TlpA disulfide reductase family protein [Candidatus Zixiibacteriota bacterium]